MRLVLVTAPSVEPLSAPEARARLNIGTDVSDDVLDGWIKSARQSLDGWDGWLGRAIITQSWKLVLDRFPECREVVIPLPPLQSFTSVKYIDQFGVQQTWAADQYQTIQGAPATLAPAFGVRWPTVRSQLGAVEVTFVAGFGPAGSDVPEPIRNAIALMVSHLRSMTSRNLFVSNETEEGIGSTSYVVGGNAGAAIDATVDALLSPYRVTA
jgi:uncharacterized phiE125 gp8 family phage protein